jgi:hypothetical protein
MKTLSNEEIQAIQKLKNAQGKLREVRTSK